MGIQYVVNGEVVENVGQAIGKMKSVDSWKAKPRPKANGSQRVHLASEATRSNGFTVVGFSPDRMQKAKEARERLVAIAQKSGGAPLQPWSDEEFMRKNNAEKGRQRPFEIAAAADECAELMRKAGWLNVRIEQHLSRREDDLPPLF